MSAPIQFGALLYDYQAIDVVGPLDLLNMCGQRIMTSLHTNYIPIDESIIAKAPNFEFHHIAETLEPVALLTSGFKLTPSTTVDTCPKLDYLLIGGPHPAMFTPSEKIIAFIRKHVLEEGKTVFSTCTGSYVLACAGVLDGKEATINNQEYEWVKARFPKVKWRRDEKWVVDGNVWTGSGAVAGMDMMSQWVKENFGLEVLAQGAAGLDYEMRDIRGRFEVLPERVDKQGKRSRGHVFWE